MLRVVSTKGSFQGGIHVKYVDAQAPTVSAPLSAQPATSFHGSLLGGSMLGLQGGLYSTGAATSSDGPLPPPRPGAAYGPPAYNSLSRRMSDAYMTQNFMDNDYGFSGFPPYGQNSSLYGHGGSPFALQSQWMQGYGDPYVGPVF
jgi:hypothetical protein